MAPTALEKAESDRNAVEATLDYLDNEMVDHITMPLDEPGIDHLITLLNASQINTMEIHTRIVHLKAPDMDIHKAAYHANMKRITSLHRQFHRIKSQFIPTSSPSAGTSGTGPATAQMKLPRLDLPSFDGNITEWMSFRDLFVTAVQNNKSLSDSQRLMHLKSALTGEAARLIRSTIITDANYPIAWKQLQDRYQNDRELLFAILRRLLNQQQVSGSSAASIRALTDTTRECISSLDVLSLPLDKTSKAFLLYITFQKLDPASKELWEQSLNHNDIPNLEDLFNFMEQRGRALLAGATTRVPARATSTQDFKKPLRSHHTQADQHCKVCKEAHPIYRCSKLRNMSISEKYETIKRISLCFNCLNEGHSTTNCSSTGRCRICKEKHNTLLHRDKDRGSNDSSKTPHVEPAASTSTATKLHIDVPQISTHCNDETAIKQSLLATALIRVKTGQGDELLCRALLDGGSTSSFITSSCFQRLNLRKRSTTTEVVGLASASVGTAKGITSIVIKPHFQASQSYCVNALIMPTVTGVLPSYACDPSVWSHLGGLELADPEYFKPAAVDILLGSDLFWSLLQDGRRCGPKEAPIGIRSTLGWLIAGPVDAISQQVNVNYADVDLNHTLQKFWEIEEITTVRFLTPEEQQAEDHFSSTHNRLTSGRYSVELPWKSPRPTIGSSRETALRRFQQLEKRLLNNPEHLKEYINFMREYTNLNHMSLISNDNVLNCKGPCYYIPHHFVLKSDSTTTKFRVVFDGSASSSNGISLNSSMLVGPTIQDSLVDILMRFRLHPIAFTADIAKMYRQIEVKEKDRDMQRILWRESTSDPIQEFRLNTVTYGTAAAPFLATRTLQQLAKDEASSLPLASEVALRDFYVDDLMSGSTTIESSKDIQNQLLEMMDRGGFSLRKWSSNCPEVLNSLPLEMRESNPTTNIDMDISVKTLGVRWNTHLDQFQFRINYIIDSEAKYTKRKVLSEISKIFDPLGWLSPVIISAKIMMQQVWKTEIGWDERVTGSLLHDWLEFQSNLNQLSSISLPRCIVPRPPSSIHLAGFCDASEKAYAAVVFMCAYFENGESCISNITSKTRVAPVKQISLPRLELCGAVLLTELMSSVQRALNIPFKSIAAWTDSTVVLGWISAHPSKWQTFIANRVTQVQSNLPSCRWNHVPGVQNPADCASRGITPEELRTHPLWWNGPDWLQSINAFDSTPIIPLLSTQEEQLLNSEEKRVTSVFSTSADDNFMITRFSSLRTLLRVTARIRRLIYKQVGPITPEELNASLFVWVKYTQKRHFAAELQSLQGSKEVLNSSKILQLRPFLDKDGLLRVGGRLRNAEISSDARNPILLPKSSHLTTLLIICTHLENFHAGPQLTLAVLYRRFWILGARDTVRYHLKKCVRCTRQAATTQQQMMGDLPSSRVNPGRPFLTCGVDYAGPFELKAMAGRSKTIHKAYLALFVCFSTRAMHLEVASSLSTDVFLAALRRFISRRGKPNHIYSDCGTNFVGANRELKEMISHLVSQQHNTAIADKLSGEGITWHFNPPGAPHFGGLWEAGVKSVKYHLHRVLDKSKLTYEELTTTIIQIEACLNSRPLTPFSTDPSDLNVLTPGHFLIGGPLTAHPEPNLSSIPEGRLDRWQLVQRLQQQFWGRWSSEVLTRMQQRPKWMKQRSQIQLHDMVLIKSELQPPQMWKLGRVIRLSPGSEGIVRVVTIQTSDGELTRPVVKLCLLPVSNVSTTSEV